MRRNASVEEIAPTLRPASEPPEERGLARDEVKLMIAGSEGIEHGVFVDLTEHLLPDDLLIVNTSATVNAELDGRRGGEPLVVHVSARMDDGTWTVELRRPDNSGPLLNGSVGHRIEVDGWGTLQVLSAYSGIEGRSRMLRVRADGEGSLSRHLESVGRPISYPYLISRWPLDSFQTVFARTPGSAEMPSAARPFSAELVARLVSSGVSFAPILLHASVSSLEKDERPLPERFSVSHSTARRVNEHRDAGGRIVAVGTTAVRALETVTSPEGIVEPGWGWTDLVLSPDSPARSVDGLITGWHPPEASHRDLLRAIAPGALIDEAYEEAACGGYMSHEFGDSCLLLP